MLGDDMECCNKSTKTPVDGFPQEASDARLGVLILHTDLQVALASPCLPTPLDQDTMTPTFAQPCHALNPAGRHFMGLGVNYSNGSFRIIAPDCCPHSLDVTEAKLPTDDAKP